MSSQGVHWFLFDIREVLTLCCSSAGSMGLDVPKTNLVVVNSCPPSAWEFSQQVLFETCYFYQFLAISTPMNPACHCSLIKWPLLFTDDQSFTFDVHYISLTYTAPDRSHKWLDQFDKAMFSKIKGRYFQNILSNSVNRDGPLLEPARSRQIK